MMINAFEKWFPQDELDFMYDIESIALRDGLQVTLIPDGLKRDALQGQRIALHWDHFLCFQVSDESYREDCWAASREDAWTFYVSSDSPYLRSYKEKSCLFPDNALHFLLVGANTIVDVLALDYPNVFLANE